MAVMFIMHYLTLKFVESCNYNCFFLCCRQAEYCHWPAVFRPCLRLCDGEERVASHIVACRWHAGAQSDPRMTTA